MCWAVKVFGQIISQSQHGEVFVRCAVGLANARALVKVRGTSQSEGVPGRGRNCESRSFQFQMSCSRIILRVQLVKVQCREAMLPSLQTVSAGTADRGLASQNKSQCSLATAKPRCSRAFSVFSVLRKARSTRPAALIRRPDGADMTNVYARRCLLHSELGAYTLLRSCALDRTFVRAR